MAVSAPEQRRMASTTSAFAPTLSAASSTLLHRTALDTLPSCASTPSASPHTDIASSSSSRRAFTSMTLSPDPPPFWSGYENVHDMDATTPRSHVPPKPQGRRTADFFAAFSPPLSRHPAPKTTTATQASDESPVVPPPPLRTPVSSMSAVHSWAHNRSRSARQEASDQTTISETGSSILSSPISDRPDRFSSSPSSSRDASPSRQSQAAAGEARASSEWGDGGSMRPTSSSGSAVGTTAARKNRTEDFFSSSPTSSSPSSTSFPPDAIPAIPTVPHHHHHHHHNHHHHPPLALARDTSLRTQLLHSHPAAKSSAFRDPPSRLPTWIAENSISLPLRPSRPPMMASLPSLVIDRGAYGRRVTSNNGRTTDNDEEVQERKEKEAEAEWQVGYNLVNPESNGAEHYDIMKSLGEGAFSKVVSARRTITRDPNLTKSEEKRGTKEGQVVAIKMIANVAVRGNERMKSSVGREIGVLKHIQHPSLVTLIATFATVHHTALVLEQVSGGELFDVVAEHHDRFTEPLVQRILGELCSAVGWMHQHGVVHRDIKLENILMTRKVFDSTSPWNSNDDMNTSLIKLTDFGLSRFVDVTPKPTMLRTRCGSEEYAAPELLLGNPYDGRLTDVWAVGVVGYALLCGYLPFGQVGGRGGGSQASVSSSGTGGTGGGGSGRRAYLIKIAKAEYAWPQEDDVTHEGSGESALSCLTGPRGQDAKHVVDRCLSRDPSKRPMMTFNDLSTHDDDGEIHLESDIPNGCNTLKKENTIWTCQWWNEATIRHVSTLNSLGSGRRPEEGSEDARILAGEH